MQHARSTAREARSMFAELQAAPARLNSDQLDVFVTDEGVEHPDGVRASADAGENRIGQAAFTLEDFGAGFVADHTMEIANHQWIGMRAQRRTEQVVRGVDVG